MIDFGQEHWFQGPSEYRRFVWDEGAVTTLVGPEFLDLASSRQLLDVGCGWGYLGHLLRPHLSAGASVLGIDLEERLIVTGRERAREVGAGELSFDLGDAARLDFDDDSFDRGICQRLLLHVSRPLEILEELRRVVRPGGRVVLIEPDLLGSAAAHRDCVSDENPDQAERTLCVHSHITDGAAAMGAGDHRIGPRLPDLLAESGFARPQLWKKPTAVRCAPPYDPTAALYRDFLLRQLEPTVVLAREAFQRDLFLAGGGDSSLWDAWIRAEQQANTLRRQRLREGSYRCSGDDLLYVGLGHVD